MKIVVVGHARAGKTVVGRILAAHLKTVAVDTSEVVVKFEAKRQEILRESGERLSPECWDNHRARPSRRFLVAAGDALKHALGPTVLADGCFARGNVCVGVRRHAEAVAVARAYPDAVFVSVDRHAESRDPDDNYDVEPAVLDARVVGIDNDGSLDELDETCRGVLEILRMEGLTNAESADRVNRQDSEIDRLWADNKQQREAVQYLRARVQRIEGLLGPELKGTAAPPPPSPPGGGRWG